MRSVAAAESMERCIVVLAVVVAVVAGAAIRVEPVLAGAGLAVAIAGAIAVLVLGSLAFPLATIVVIPLIPIAASAQTTSGTTAASAGTAGAVRLILIVAFIAGGLVSFLRSGHRLESARLRALVTALIVLAAMGLFAAVANAHGGQHLIKMVASAAGQPLAYAGCLVLFAIAIRSNERNRELLLCAWAIVMLAEALVVAGQFATGAAYDSLRGFTRGQGTTGADFLGAFSAMSLYGGLALRSQASSPRIRLLGSAAVVAATATVMASVSRGAVVGIIVGLAYLLFHRQRGVRGSTSNRVAIVLVLAALVGGGLYATQSLWSSRLNAKSTQAFDRPATWVSGLRIAVDHPLAGVGPGKVQTVVVSSQRYSANEYGVSGNNPHNSWLVALDEGGLAYGIALVWVTVLLVQALRRAPYDDSSKRSLYLKASLVTAAPLFFINNLFTHPEIMILVCLATAAVITPRRIPMVRGSSIPISHPDLARPAHTRA